MTLYDKMHKSTCDMCGREEYIEDLIYTEDHKDVCSDCLINCPTCGAQWAKGDYLFFDEVTSTVTCELCKDE